MDLGLKGKIALVTGGSRGIGRAIALALAEEGCRIAICARDQESLERTAAEIDARGGVALPLRADATVDADAARVVQSVVQSWGTLQILVNNVGGGGGRAERPVDATPLEYWRAVYELNAGAALRFTLLALPHMRRAAWGRVVTIASVKGYEGGGRPWYNMAKAAEISLMKSLALDADLVRAGITFNSIVPGRVAFPGNGWDLFRQQEPDRYEERMKRDMPVGRCGTPEEIAAAVAFVCSERASFVNGASFAVDGGESRRF
jgi:3-oxoacyl-[acyl-carrier protein] reductase